MFGRRRLTWGRPLGPFCWPGFCTPASLFRLFRLVNEQSFIDRLLEQLICSISILSPSFSRPMSKISSSSNETSRFFLLFL